MFEDADNFTDVFRISIPYYLFIILLICFSNPVLASSEFNVYRMSQFDVNGVAYGCRASALNLEAKSLYSWSTSRHCVVTRFQDITIDQFKEIRSKAGGLIALLPKNISSLSDDGKEQIYLLEQAMMSQEISIPIYFSPYNIELEKVIDDITKNLNENNNITTAINLKRQSAFNELIQTLSANGYQIFISGASHSPNKQSKVPIIQGELAPIKNLKSNAAGGSSDTIASADINNKLPLIIIVAHLDTFGLYNKYLLNSDVAAVLTIADLFSKLYSISNSAPKYRLMFVITESGALTNFQGAKKWLDENTQIQNVDFVLCLDTITEPIAIQSNTLYMHVSKPPKDNTPMSNFYKQLSIIAKKYDNISTEGVHKKINLAEQLLGWEHERFSMKRFPAFTLSSLKSHKDPLRTTIFKDNKDQIILNTRKNTKILAESLARYIYNINENDDGEIFSGAIDVNDKLIDGWMKIKSTLHNNDLKNSFEKYLRNVKITYEKPDNREPDFMFYEGQDAMLFVYRVKPAIFDLFLTLLIAAYLGCVYLIIIYFPEFYSQICKISSTSLKSKLN